MRGVLFAGIFALIAFLVWWWPLSAPKAPVVPIGLAPGTTTPLARQSAPAPASESAAKTEAAAGPSAPRSKRPPGPPVVPPAMAEMARLLHADGTTESDDLEIIQTLVAYYRRANAGDGPGGGLNHEIVAALRGENENGIAVLPSDLLAFSAAGELLDRWGTPYYFHPISRTVLEIRSLGPDKKLWTSDDIESGAPASEATGVTESLTRN
jgi:hypothetical protein